VQPVLEQVDAVCHLGEIPSVHAGIARVVKKEFQSTPHS
jgi:hypothetical protein